MASTPHRHQPDPAPPLPLPKPATPPLPPSAAPAPTLTTSPAPRCSPLFTVSLPELLLLGDSPAFDPLLARAHKPRCARAITTREAEKFLRALPFRLVLATENLPGYPPYSLVPHLLGHPVNFFIAIELRHSTLWLPALLDGQRALGLTLLDSRALLPLLLSLPSIP